MSEPVQDQPGRFVQCETVRDLIERYSSLSGPYSLSVENTAVLKLVSTINGKIVTVVAEASWLAALWRMRPGDRRPIRTAAALTAALEARSRCGRAEPLEAELLRRRPIDTASGTL
jgi:hypothetical protein